jgi:hypothetical protein
MEEVSYASLCSLSMFSLSFDLITTDAPPTGVVLSRLIIVDRST